MAGLLFKLAKLGPAVRRAIWAAGAARSPFCAWVELEATVDPANDAPVWVHVATEGNYRGHAAGEFTLDRPVFEQLVKNFRAHPAFKLGADGFGCEDVIAYDWRHASEQPPAAGGAETIVVQAAHGWARDLDIRTGTDGKAQLWALSMFLGEAKKLISEKRIKWTSVAIWPNAPDPVTGENVGWYLSSIALTNDPFIQGMTPIAASRYFDPYDRPCSPTDVVEKLRRLFGLAEMADLGVVLQQIATLRAAASGAMAAPPGVDVDELVGALRFLFNLPTLASAAAVFDEADKLIGALADELRTNPATPLAADRKPQPPTAGGGAPPKTEETITVDPKLLALIALLAGALQVPATFEAVELEAKRLHLDRPGTLKVLLDTAGGAAGSDVDSATKKIQALLAAVGVQDPEQACRELVDRAAQAKALLEALPELEQILEDRAASEDQMAEEDVGQMLIARGYSLDALDPHTRDVADVMMFKRCGATAFAFSFDRDNKPTDKVLERIAGIRKASEALKQRVECRRAFYAEYAEQPPPAPAGGHYLTSKLFANPGAGQPPAPGAAGGGPKPPPWMRGAEQGHGGQPPAHLGRPQGPGQGPGGGAPPAHQGKTPHEYDLSRFSGNLRQRALACASERMGDQWKKLSQADQFRKASELLAYMESAGYDLEPYRQVA
jgi:hypothetical protein